MARWQGSLHAPSCCGANVLSPCLPCVSRICSLPFAYIQIEIKHPARSDPIFLILATARARSRFLNALDILSGRLLRVIQIQKVRLPRHSQFATWSQQDAGLPVRTHYVASRINLVEHLREQPCEPWVVASICSLRTASPMCGMGSRQRAYEQFHATRAFPRVAKKVFGACHVCGGLRTEHSPFCHCGPVFLSTQHC